MKKSISPSPAHLAAAAGSASTLGSEHTGNWVSNELISHSISHPDQGEISAVSPALLGEKDRKAAVEPLQTWWTGVQRGVAPPTIPALPNCGDVSSFLAGCEALACHSLELPPGHLHLRYYWPSLTSSGPSRFGITPV